MENLKGFGYFPGFSITCYSNWWLNFKYFFNASAACQHTLNAELVKKVKENFILIII